MVQKKITITSKLGVQVDHHKIEKRLSNNLKPSFSTQNHQDGKNRGPKKMKKYKSVELSDVENLKSSSMEKNINISKPEKTPSTPPQKQPVIIVKSVNGSSSPNYMKATSSSDGKIHHRRNKLASDGGSVGTVSKTVTNILSRTSSLKKTMMRSLTKTPSFKPVNRGLTKKCSSTRVAICSDVDMIQKSTCSSTLKDSKFPSFVMLNPGGTESEGTSVEKVCPYSYCSLNGHHHAVSPPLKSFISARRRSLKTLRSSKPEKVTSRKVKPLSWPEIVDVDKKQLVFDEEVVKLTWVEDFCIEIENQKHISNHDYMATREINGMMNHDAETMSDDFNGSSFECCDDVASSASSMELYCGTGFLEDDEFTYMEWEEGKVSGSESDIEPVGLVKSTDNNESDSICDESDSICDESVGFVNDCSDAVLVDQSSPEDIFEDEGLGYVTQSDVSDSDSDSEITEIVIVEMAPEVETEISSSLADEIKPESATTESSIHAADDLTGTASETIFFRPGRRSDEEPPCNNLKWTIGKRTLMEDNEESKDFNPREPNYLPVVPDPDSEKVDLKHQEIDGRKNTEEWMVDYALRQAVAKLGPARKLKVGLLIQAFETVAPIPKWGGHIRHSSTTFGHGRTVQACS